MTEKFNEINNTRLKMIEKFKDTHLVEIYFGKLYVKGFKFLDEKGGIIANVGYCYD